jgi:hypothetical protein
VSFDEFSMTILKISQILTAYPYLLVGDITYKV